MGLVFVALAVTSLGIAVQVYLKAEGKMTPAQHAWLRVVFIFAGVSIGLHVVQLFFQSSWQQERHMWPHRKACLILLAVLLGLVSACQIQSIGQRMLVLLTPQEAGQLRLTEEE